MIKKVRIHNFKSIEDIEFELGSKINIIIGANGSGKTNILESIVMGAAASADKLDYEFLGNRIRITSPEYMLNAFYGNKNKEIVLEYELEEKNIDYKLVNDKNDYRKWIDLNKTSSIKDANKVLRKIFTGSYQIDNANIDQDEKQMYDSFKSLVYTLNVLDKKSTSEIESIIPLLTNEIIGKELSDEILSRFLIYTPELSYLKKFEEPSQIVPLGVKGEGLFYELKKLLSNNRKTKQINEIKEYLHLLDWFEDFSIPKDLMSNEFRISIKDRFISSSHFFDQRSSNEGFLYLLFYLILFTHENTPSFFAIDNIETGFNPKLCTELIKSINHLAGKYKKQTILTTHNPSILDGIDLKDDNQRLFIARRNRLGKTVIERIEQKPQSKLKLSELWTKGYIGGLPDNF